MSSAGYVEYNPNHLETLPTHSSKLENGAEACQMNQAYGSIDFGRFSSMEQCGSK